MFSALLRYEQLPTFCFFCGRIGHSYRNCSLNVENLAVGDMIYGTWIGGVDLVISNLVESFSPTVPPNSETVFTNTSSGVPNG